MRKIWFVTVIFIGIKSFSQTSSTDLATVKIDTLRPKQDLVSLDSISKRRNQLNKTNMTILAAWAGVNIIQSSISAGNATGTDKAFFKMNAYWNTVNLALARIVCTNISTKVTRPILHL